MLTIFVTTGLDPVVHADPGAAWIAGSNPAMTRGTLSLPLLTTPTLDTTSTKPCAATGVSRAIPETAARAAPRQKKAPRWSARRRAPLRISLRRRRDAEGGCRARSAEGGDADCVARIPPCASRRSAPVAFWGANQWPPAASAKTRAQRRRENVVACLAVLLLALRTVVSSPPGLTRWSMLTRAPHGLPDQVRQ